jgi:8-oxo-dGTP pyrophosphatase MutT (NUDIX family)
VTAGPHASAIAVLESWTSPDAEQARRQADYLTHLHARPDGVLRDCFPDHLTASTLVLSADGRQVLLTLHAKARAWFQLGGHIESSDATLASAALREATEESGIDGLVLDPAPVQLSPHAVPFCSPRGTVRHLDVRFVAVGDPESEHRVSEESSEVRWWPADDLPSDEPSLHELVALGRAGL